jgi:hypothetical protein
MNDSFIAKSMFKVLAGKDAGLAARFLAIQERALTDWIPHLRVDKGSHSGLVHLINVGRNVDKMIPEDKKGELSAGEIFLLLSAVLFHDIGRISEDQYRLPYCFGKRRFRNFCVSNPLFDIHPPPCMKPEWDHYKKSEDIILEIGLEQGLPDAMAVKYCALLAYCHGLSKPPRVKQDTFMDANCTEKEKPRSEFRNTSIEPHGTVRIPLLAALLRIADETENHWTRAIGKRWYEHYKKNQQNLGKAFRRRVEDVEFSPAGECIVMHLEEVPSKDSEELSRFAGVARSIETVLKFWGPELRPLGLDFNRVFFETGGRLWRFNSNKESPEPVETPMAKVMKKNTSSLGDLDQDSLRIGQLHKALMSLSKITMGYPDFTLAAVEAEAGRPLNERDKWLIERMADWVPWAISVDPVRERVRVHIKSGADLFELPKKPSEEDLIKRQEDLNKINEDLNKMSMELIGEPSN